MADVPAPRSDTVSPSTFVITNADWTSRHYPGAYLIVVEAGRETSRPHGKLPIVRLRGLLFPRFPSGMVRQLVLQGKVGFLAPRKSPMAAPKSRFPESPGIEEDHEARGLRRCRFLASYAVACLQGVRQ